MDALRQALRYAWPYRLRLASAVASCLIVALFWGANISILYPVLTVLLDRKTLVDWAHDRLTLEEQSIAKLKQELSQSDLAPAVRSRREGQLHSHQRTLRWFNLGMPTLERYAPADSFRTLAGLIGLVMIGLLIKGFFDFLQEYLAGSVVQLMVFDLRNRFFRRTVRLDLAHFSDQGTHDLLARFTNDTESLSNGLRLIFGRILLEPLKATSCLFFALWFNWRLTLLTMVLFPLSAVVLGYLGQSLRRGNRRNLESMSRMYKILQESFMGIRIVQAFCRESHESRRFFQEGKRYLKQSLKLTRTDAITGPVLEFFAVGAVTGALLVGSYLVMTGKTHLFNIRLSDGPIEQSMLITFYALILGMCDPLRKVSGVYGKVQRAIASAERVFQVMEQRPTITSKPKAADPPRHAHSIEFVGVAFGYSTRQPILRQIDLRVGFGESIAVVGPTGSGKTSLVNLLPRFYDPTAGAVRLDGVDLRDVQLRGLRQQISVVTQHTVLFDDTIAANIAYGRPDATAVQIAAAARAAHADRFIDLLPLGYQTRIGEMGASLSGGQRQRLALARAFLRDPAILILDEATSSLDVESESLIHQALRRFMKHRTTFIVTHRFSTLDIVDRIVVLNSGLIEAVGARHELLETSETFRRLHDVHHGKDALIAT